MQEIQVAQITSENGGSEALEEAATRQGVMVVNAPQSNILSAAEHTMALLLALARNVPQADAALRAGRWDRERFQGVELHGKTLGIVGLGRVGTMVAQRALAFGMRLIAYDPYVSRDRARELSIELMPDLGALLVQSEFVTIHLPRTPTWPLPARPGFHARTSSPQRCA